MGLADNFKGDDIITLQPGDAIVPYSFRFTVCSGTTKNDGALPYGETISSCTVTAHTEAGTAATTSVIETTSLTSFTEMVWLNYPTALGAGRYHLTFLVYLTATSQSIEFDFNRIVAKNI